MEKICYNVCNAVFVNIVKTTNTFFHSFARGSTHGRTFAHANVRAYTRVNEKYVGKTASDLRPKPTDRIPQILGTFARRTKL